MDKEKQTTLAQLLDGTRRSAEQQYGADALNQPVLDCVMVVRFPKVDNAHGRGPADCFVTSFWGGRSAIRSLARSIVAMNFENLGPLYGLMFLEDFKDELLKAMSDAMLGGGEQFIIQEPDK